MMERHSLCALMTAAVTLTSGSHGLIRLYSICNRYPFKHLTASLTRYMAFVLFK